jgi:hypothetical protein
LFIISGLGGPRQNTQFLAEQSINKVGPNVPPACRNLGSSQAIVELSAGRVGDGRPHRAPEHHSFLVARNSKFLATVPVVFDDYDR